MPHPNAMTAWPEIRCQRGCEEHRSLQAHVKLGGPTPYRDLTSIPDDLAVEFDMLVWDTLLTPVDGGPYCPARDAVSQTITSLGVWEPRETVMALRVFKENPGKWFYDFGAQVGWFSLLAGLHGLLVAAYEADNANWMLLKSAIGMTHLSDLVYVEHGRIGPESLPIGSQGEPIALVKIDLEGAENEAIRMLRQPLDDRLVERMMIEVSPVFDDYYPDLVLELMFGYGFRAFLLPPKQIPAFQLTGDPHELWNHELVGKGPAIRDTVASWHQEDVWFVREDLM